MKVRPLYECILVKRVEEETKTAAVFSSRHRQGKTAAGCHCCRRSASCRRRSLRKLEVKRGQGPVRQDSGSTSRWMASMHMILREDDILRVIE